LGEHAFLRFHFTGYYQEQRMRIELELSGMDAYYALYAIGQTEDELFMHSLLPAYGFIGNSTPYNGDALGLCKIHKSCAGQEKAITEAMKGIADYLNNINRKPNFNDCMGCWNSDVERSKLRKATQEGLNPEIICHGAGHSECKDKGCYRVPPQDKIHLCPDGLAGKYGLLECVLLHEMIHAVLNIESEAIAMRASKCYSDKCKGYGL
jgi:hypothetical protein